MVVGSNLALFTLGKMSENQFLGSTNVMREIGNSVRWVTVETQD